MNTWLDFSKTASKKVVHKVGEFIGNKVADAVTIRWYELFLDYEYNKSHDRSTSVDFKNIQKQFNK